MFKKMQYWPNSDANIDPSDIENLVLKIPEYLPLILEPMFEYLNAWIMYISSVSERVNQLSQKSGGVCKTLTNV